MAAKTNSSQAIGASESIRSTFGYNGYDYVCTGSYHKGEATLRVDAYRVVPEHEYKGKTLTYMERYNNVNRGTWTYEGIRVRLKGVWYVLTKKIVFILDAKAPEPCTVGAKVTVKAPRGKELLELF